MSLRRPFTLLALLAVIASLLAVAPPAGAADADPVVSEVMANPSSAEDDWEWLELHNPGSTDIDLAGWVVDDINGVAHSSANIAAGTIPAGGSAILFNDDDIDATDFTAAWGPDLNLVPVAGWASMALNNGGDTVGLWDSFASYTGDHATHANAVVSVTDPGTIDDGAGSIHLTDLQDPTSWALSTDGLATPVGTSYTSTAAGGNAGTDIGSPMVNVTAGPMTPVVSEIMANPSSAEDDWEWLELHNPGSTDIDLAGWVVDDINGVAHSSANIAAGTIPAGGSAILFNDDDIDATDFTAAWGPDLNLVPVAGWASMALNNGGDTVGLWDSFASYTGDHATHANAVVSVTDPGTIDDGAGSIHLTDLQDPTSWALSTDGLATPVGTSYTSTAAGGNAGTDIGSPVASTPADAEPTATTCPATVNVLDGVADSFTVGATDADDPLAVTATDVTPDDGAVTFGTATPGAAGAEATQVVDVADTASGSYTVEVTFTTYDTGQQVTCTLTVQVAGITPIHDVQGDGAASPMDGQEVTISGIVTSLFEDDDTLDAFFLQEEDAEADANPDTSEGIFAFCRGNCPSGLAVGDHVTATGDVDEFFGMTQLNITGGSATIESSGNALPSAVALPLGTGSTLEEATFEAIEGMLVTHADPLYVAEYFQLARYGEVVLAAGGRPFQYSHVDETPTAGEYATFLDDLHATTIRLDDDNNDQNDATVGAVDEAYPYPTAAWKTGGLSSTNFFRGGETISNLTGVLHWSFAGQSGTDAWRIRPVHGLAYEFSGNDRPASPVDVGGDVVVAGMNVLNYFTTPDAGANTCGPSNLECRGGHSTDEIDRQLAKLVEALVAIDADVLGLVELENNATTSLSTIVDALNVELGAGTYDYVNSGTLGTDAIKVGILYKPGSVTPVGTPEVLDTAAFTNPNADPTPRNRPALGQTFIAEGDEFTVVVNHLKSKGDSTGNCSGLDCDQGDGQGNYNDARTKGAEALAAWINATFDDEDVLILGDLNAYKQEDPIDALEAAGYVDAIEAVLGDEAYSYLFAGQLGYLDYAMPSAELMTKVTDVEEWHINADEISLLDYNDTIQDGNEASFERYSSALPLYEANPYRTSDHDPVIVGLDLAPTRTIPEIQGAGHTSPHVGEDVGDVHGIVTEVVGNGFHLQDPVGDGDDATSDAIFVYTGSTPAVAVGDEVEVDGTVSEFGFSGELTTTQIVDPVITGISTGAALPTATTIGTGGRVPPATVIDDDGLGSFDPAADGIDFFESLESMRVEVASSTVVGPDRFGEITVLVDGGAGVDQRTDAGGVHISPTDFNPERVIVDFDDIGGGAPDATIGDTLDPVTGVMGYTFGNFKVLTRETGTLTAGTTTEETTTVAGTASRLTVATYNVLNLDPSDGSQFDEIAADIVDHLGAPDIVGLQEIQDNSGSTDDGTVDADQTLQALVDAIANAGGPAYAFTEIAPVDNADGGAPGSNIRVAYLYNPSRVGLDENPGDATTATAVDGNGDLTLNPGRIAPNDPAWSTPEGTRRPLAAQFTFNGHDVVVINTHLKSKSQDDALFGATQPPVEHTSAQRVAQAEVVNAFVDEVLAADGDANIVVLGDMNDFEFSAPLDALAGDVLTNLVEQVPAAERWTYVFDGNSQVLDNVLVSESLADGASPVIDIVHTNTPFDPSARASDHDPVLIGLTLPAPSTGGGNNGGGGDPTEEPTDPPIDPAEGASIREACADDATCTSVTVSQLTFADGNRSFLRQLLPGATAAEALLASDLVFADALASGTLQDTRPLLLNSPTELEGIVLAELQRLGVEDVWILGGTAAVSQDVEDQLVAEGLSVTRLAGPTRLETAQVIAAHAGDDQPALVARAYGPGEEGDPTQAFADSLAVGGWAADDGRSVLLSETDQLSGSTAAWLEASASSEATLVGGVAALAEEVATAIAELGFGSARVSGATRFETAVEVATARGFGADAPASTVIISEGQADDAWEGGFSAAAPAAVFDAPILLANGDDLPEPTQAFLDTAVEAGAEVICLASQVACDAAVEAIG